MSDNKPIAINLLKASHFDATQLGETFIWLLTIGKTIVFLSFAIVIFFFLYRFSLDKKIESLNDEINNNIEVIKQYSQYEPAIRNLQTKLETIDQLTSQNPKFKMIFATWESCLPAEIQVDSLNLNNEQLYFTGTVPNEIIFTYLIAALNQQDLFTKVIVGDLISKGALDPTVSFTISLYLNKDSAYEDNQG